MVIDRDQAGKPRRMIGIHQDITANKKIQQELQESQAQLSLFIQHAPAALAMFDKNMCYLAASNRWLEDYKLQDQAILGRSHYEVFPEIAEAWKQIHQRALSGEIIKNDSDCFIRSNGEPQWLRWEVRPWRSQFDEIGGIAIFAEDITQQKLTENERQRWADAFQCCAQGIAIGNPETNLIEFCNPAFAKLTGHKSPSELRGVLIASLYQEDQIDQVIQHLHEADHLGQIRYESRYRRLDGSTLDVQVDIASVKGSDGKLLYRVATVQDISQRKQDEQTLLLQSSALNAAANAIVITDAKGVIEWINPAFSLLTGHSTTESIGHNLDELSIIDASSQENFQAMLASLKQGKLWQGELLNRRKDGSFYTVEQTITPVFDDKLRLQHFVAIENDISQRKRNEFELERHRYHLQELIEERTTELDQARMEAERLSLVKTSFLANMSHEIRTPMNAVLGFCHLLQQHPLDKHSQTLVEKIHSAGNSLLNIINDILDFSKIEAGKIDIETAPLRLPELLDELAAMMMTIASNKQLDLIITPPRNVDGMQGDKQRLQQILTNLLANAIKFTEHGEVELRIELIQTEDHQENLRFMVRDTGIGVPAEKQAEIFSVFSQADSSITRRFGGSGLGLAISSQLVELMGGKLELSSEEGLGSEFSFELPLQRTIAAELSMGQLVALRLLVADDSAVARGAVTNTIQSLGWQADVVDSGEVALSRILAQRGGTSTYDVILLDWQMPELDGLSTAKLIREALARPDVELIPAPIIVMVTAADHATVIALPEAKYVDVVLNKPLTASTLYNAVADIIGHRHISLQLQAPNLQADQLPNIPGIQILVVDDSEINREVAQLLLSSHGAVVNLANNGQEAVDWMHANPDTVDIILMDVQMPVLDGYSATRLLRKDPRWQNLPIVALSAGVFKEDVALAHAAGMNNFISKPFNVKQLLTTIQRLTGSDSNVNGFDSSIMLPNPQATLATSMAELPDIAFDEFTWRWGNDDVYRRYLRQFAETYANCGTSIAKLIAEYDQPGAAALAHKLKGAAGTLGLKIVAAQAEMVETSLRQGSFSTAVIESLQSAIDKASVAIADWQPERQAPEPDDTGLPCPDTSPEALIELLQQLLQAMDQDNPAFAKPALAKLQHKIPETLFAQIQAQLTLYDFRAAEALTLAALNNIQANTNHN